MIAVWTSICSAIVLCCTAAFLWTAEAGMQNTDFWTEAAVSSMAEVALSNVALQKAQSDAVKQFAQRMVDDHTRANQELMTAAQAKGVTVPTALPDNRQRDVTDLNGETGDKFDREYMQMMVKDHDKAVKLFQREAERGTDADAKALAARLLPALQEHLTMARSLNDTMRGNRGGNDRGNSSNVNRSTNVRQDTERNPNRNDNAGGNTNGNTNTGGNTNRGYSNLRPNVNANANTNTNSNSNRRTNRNTNSNSNSNSNSNTNFNSGNANNGNTGNMNHR